MDIAGTGTIGLYGSSTTKQTQSLKQVFRSAPVGETAATEPGRERGKALGRADGFALGALRQEIRGALSEKFSVAFSSVVGAYERSAPTASDVAGDALAAAGQVVKSAPLDASAALKELRSDVAAAGEKVRDVVDEADLDDVEEAMARIDKGLDKADDDAARNTISSASFLSAESTLRQRSTIRIRTQEGDVVRLDLRRRESFSAEDVSLQGPQGSFTSTELSASSRSRLAFTVRGDINEQELAAIQGVFERAESIAADFFGGDLARAFDAASGLEFDSEQLSRVRLSFREREVTRVNFAQFGTVLPAERPDAAASPVGEPGAVLPSPEADRSAPPAVRVARAPAPTSEQPAAADIPPAGVGARPVDDDQASSQTEAPVAPAPEAEDPIDAFAEMLGSFLRSTLEGFGSGGEQRFFFGESFRLNILRSVITVSAPDGAEQAGEVAGKLIDAVSTEDGEG
ncbi:MAG: hypothetical protein V2J24_09925 [Pseudomonadales bacterium]|jgi:hypothetical protein|nr:hypothetical protein [Pseudomonadales bacterium]